MTVVFRLTQRDLWRFHQHAKHRKPLIAVLRLASVPLFFFLMAYFGGFGLAGSMTVLVLSALLPLLAFGLMLLDMRRDVRRDAANVSGRIAEIGKFDFRWGSPTKDGYYYHWSYFAAIADELGCLKFTLQNGRQFLIPKAAFADDAEAARFASLALERWEAAKARARYEAVVSEGVWPPPPRVRD